MLAACGGEAKRPLPAAAGPAPQPGLVHGADISLLAVTEDGAAAFSADEVGDLRLWPALDGSRPPVPVAAHAPTDIALSPRAGGWLATVIDDAGELELLRFASDGLLRGRARAADDVRYLEAVAFGDRVLARREDESLVALDDLGHPLGRIAAASGERIVALATRHGAVLAAIAGSPDTGSASEEGVAGARSDAQRRGESTEVDETVTELRWVEREPLRWGATIVLPMPIGLPIALAPGHTQFATRSVDHTHALVFAIEISGTVRIPDDDDNMRPDLRPPITSLGFTSDDRLGILGPTKWWEMMSDHRGHLQSAGIPFLREGIFVDGEVVGGNGPSILLADPNLNVHYLGYRDVPTTMTMNVAGDEVMMDNSSEGRNLWFDGMLHETRSFAIPSESYAVDDHHVIAATSTDGERRMSYVLVDVAHPNSHVALGEFADVSSARFDHDRRQLLISRGNNTVSRIHLDATFHATQLPALDASNLVVLFDPARAGNLVAMDVDYSHGGPKLVFFHEDPSAKHIAHTEELVVDGNLVAHDLAGTVYVQEHDHPARIAVIAGAKLVRRFDLDAVAERNGALGGVSHDGKLVVIAASNQLFAVDPEGHVRWRVPMFRPVELGFTDDDRALFVMTRSGIVKLDGATGAQLATGCAWRFGLYDVPTGQSSFGERPLCGPQP